MQTDAPIGHSDVGISVVIPTYKRPERLRTAIASAQAQTFTPLEVLVCDNDTGFSAQSVCNELGLSTVTYIPSSKVIGPSFARNEGARAARGEWLAFLDDDDHWLPEYLQTVLDTASVSGADLVLCPTFRETAEGRAPGKNPRLDISVDALLARGNTGVLGSNTMISAEAFKHLGGFDETMRASEDVDLLARLLENNFSYAVAPARLVVQRIEHKNRLSGESSIFVYQGRRRLAEKHRHFISKGSRTQLLGRAHVAGFNARRNIIYKLWHLIAAARYSNFGPAGAVLRKGTRGRF